MNEGRGECWSLRLQLLRKIDRDQTVAGGKANQILPSFVEARLQCGHFQNRGLMKASEMRAVEAAVYGLPVVVGSPCSLECPGRTGFRGREDERRSQCHELSETRDLRRSPRENRLLYRLTEMGSAKVRLRMGDGLMNRESGDRKAKSSFGRSHESQKERRAADPYPAA